MSNTIRNFQLNRPNSQSLDLSYETSLWKRGFNLVIGVDEVGRGAFAGPATAAAVAFSADIALPKSVKITDSKKLRPLERLKAEKWIRKNCLSFAVCSGSVALINKYGIVKTCEKIMRQAIRSIIKTNQEAKCFVLADAFYIKYIVGVGLSNQLAIIKGDAKVFSIAAASILAKTYRDRYMRRLSARFPMYGWGRNKGYGTNKHQAAITKHGKTKHHRNWAI